MPPPWPVASFHSYWMSKQATHINSLLKPPFCLFVFDGHLKRSKFVEDVRINQSPLRTVILDGLSDKEVWRMLFHIATLPTTVSVSVWAGLYLIHHPSISIYGVHLPSFDLSAESLQRSEAQRDVAATWRQIERPVIKGFLYPSFLVDGRTRNEDFWDKSCAVC